MANGHGGQRPGSGRRPLREHYREDSEAAEKLIAGHLTKAAQNIITLADGGNLAANQYLIDRILGKPVQSAEVSGPGGTPIVDFGDGGITTRLAEICDSLRTRRDSIPDTSTPRGDGANTH